MFYRFPYQNFNSPPFPKRAPLDFIKGRFNDKIYVDDKDRIGVFRDRDVKFTKKGILMLNERC